MKITNTVTCKQCGQQFKQFTYFDDLFKWFSQFGVRCPKCGKHYISRFEIIAIIILALVPIAFLVKALLTSK